MMRRVLLIAVLPCVLAVGCSNCGEEPPVTNNGNNFVNNEPNGDTNNATNNVSNNASNNGNNATNNATNNGTNNVTNNGMFDAPEDVRQTCAAGGTSSGGGFTAVHCFGPAEVVAGEASGGGFTWKAGVTHVIPAQSP